MNSQPKVPFLDLVTPHMEMREELMAVFEEALRTAGYVGGLKVEAFETEFAEFCGAKYCVGVNSGTDAIRFMLMGPEFHPGETVVTVPHTFIASTEAITQAGLRFEFVDIDERTFNIDPKKLEEFLESCSRDSAGRVISKKTGSRIAAIMPVHLYGQPADMDAFLALGERFHLPVFEDACQAHGAEYFSAREKRWRKAGSMGQAAAFSFYPGKNLGALGEAGAITTDREDIAKLARTLRQHGELKRYHHEMEGYNGRLDAIQAGFLSAKLKRLKGWVEQRREVAARYEELLAPLGGKVRVPFGPAWAKSCYHLYVVRVENREHVQKGLADAGVGTGIHYPIPLHLQPAYVHLGYREGDFPAAEKAAKEILSLPMYPQLKPEQQRHVAEQLAAVFETTLVG
jgi:dTDP-4-amino-4,6-dideoxygalactose transaminase